MSGKQRTSRQHHSSPDPPMERIHAGDSIATRRSTRRTQLINPPSPETEVRRSVRATKGQHKALEAQDQPIEAPKRRGKKNKKAAPEPEEPEEEIIRCVCGATEQDEDSGEPWIACDTCGAWQHNICMGMSQYTEDLPKEYFCEQCRPENHKDLLAGIDRGEKPWEARRKAYEEEKNEKKKRGTKKGTKKRASDPKEEVAQASQKSKPSPAPEPKKESKSTAGQKRKVADGPPDKESKQAQKIRKVSETQSAPVDEYTPPDDLAAKITELSETRQGPAKALSKGLLHSIGALEKKGLFTASDGVTAGSRAERLALQIERAVHDTHPAANTYTNQIRTLAFNLKTNTELCASLLNHSLSPNTIATKPSEQLATKEHQKEVTEMKAKAEKQAVKITDPNLRIIRKTHKGDEMVGDEGFTSEAVPTGPAPRATGRDKSEPLKKAEGDERRVSVAHSGHSRSPTQDLAIDTQQSPSRADFDINKVFSSVKSPTLSHNRRPSAVAAPASGPGIDPDVDRMLEDGTQSPPYSPREDAVDPDAVWRGNLVMNTIAEVQVVAKHMGGAKLNETIGLAWEKLIPKTLTVCGRIDEQQAIAYLCGLRYSVPTDIVVVSLEPTSERAKANMQKLVDYFVSKKRYGVIGDKGIANVRDTYLVPVLPGSANHPEFMMNLGDNFLPETRTEPVMLAVFVYRNDPEVVQRVQASATFNNSARLQETVGASFAQSPGTPTPQPGGLAANLVRSNRQSVSAPAFSPTSPQGTFPNYPSPRNSHTPAHTGLPPTPTPHNPNNLGYGRQDQQQRQSEQVAREVLGPLITSPTVGFLLPQADQMTRKEWEVIKKIYERDPKARDDLPHLSSVLEKQTAESASSQASHPPAQAQAQAQQPAPVPPRPQPSQAHTQAQSHTQPPPQIHQQQQAPHPPPPSQPQPTAIRNTPIPPPPIPPTMASRHQPPVRQTPIPPPPIPPQAMPAATPVQPPNPPA